MTIKEHAAEAIEHINRLFSDTTVSEEEQIEVLLEIASEVSNNIEMLTEQIRMKASE
jgi:hypothetical protein